jgi:hypothetical protein
MTLSQPDSDSDSETQEDVDVETSSLASNSSILHFNGGGGGGHFPQLIPIVFDSSHKGLYPAEFQLAKANQPTLKP